MDQRKVGERLELVVEDQEPGNPTAIWAQPVIFHDATKCSNTGHSNCNVFGDDAAFKCTTGNAIKGTNCHHWFASNGWKKNMRNTNCG